MKTASPSSAKNTIANITAAAAAQRITRHRQRRRGRCCPKMDPLVYIRVLKLPGGAVGFLDVVHFEAGQIYATGDAVSGDGPRRAEPLPADGRATAGGAGSTTAECDQRSLDGRRT